MRQLRVLVVDAWDARMKEMPGAFIHCQGRY
jgi:hypothetical protein